MYIKLLDDILLIEDSIQIQREVYHQEKITRNVCSKNNLVCRKEIDKEDI